MTYRGKKLQKNQANITTANEQVALYNYRKKYPALRLQFKINYIVYRREGWFLTQENPAVLPQLCRTNKRYYAGSLRVLAQFYKQTVFCLDYRQACLGRKQGSRQSLQTGLQTLDQEPPEGVGVKADEQRPAPREFNELPYALALWVNAQKAGNPAARVQFCGELKVTLPHALLQQPIGVLVSALQTNALGSHPAEGFDLVRFEHLPRLDYELFYVREELRRAGVREDLSSLLVHLVEQRYLNARTNIATLADSGDAADAAAGSREVIEQFLKFDHVNIQALGRLLRRVRARADAELKGLWALVERLACVDSATLGRSGLLGRVVSSLATVQMLRDDARELEFKVAQEYCRLVMAAQKKRVEAEKKKKLRVQRQAEFAREDTALIRQVVLALHPETAAAHAAYFDKLLEELSAAADAAKKAKVRAPAPKTADFLAELGGAGADQ